MTVHVQYDNVNGSIRIISENAHPYVQWKLQIKSPSVDKWGTIHKHRTLNTSPIPHADMIKAFGKCCKQLINGHIVIRAYSFDKERYHKQFKPFYD